MLKHRFRRGFPDFHKSMISLRSLRFSHDPMSSRNQMITCSRHNAYLLRVPTVPEPSGSWQRAVAEEKSYARVYRGPRDPRT